MRFILSCLLLTGCGTAAVTTSGALAPDGKWPLHLTLDASRSAAGCQGTASVTAIVRNLDNGSSEISFVGLDFFAPAEVSERGLRVAWDFDNDGEAVSGYLVWRGDLTRPSGELQKGACHYMAETRVTTGGAP